MHEAVRMIFFVVFCDFFWNFSGEKKLSVFSLMNEERRLKELEYKIPFIYECMGNTIYGNKHMELKDLEFTIREKEHDVSKKMRLISQFKAF